MTVLRRYGNKQKIAGEISKYFPFHTIYAEPFFGAGGMFFNKPQVRYNYMNDLDGEIINLYKVISYNPQPLIDLLNEIPISSEIMKRWNLKNIKTEILVTNYEQNGLFI